jgi:hypothetical protein
MSSAAGLLGLTLSGAGLAWHLLASVLIGAGFGALFHFQPGYYAATISAGLLYGLQWWILGPLTLAAPPAGLRTNLVAGRSRGAVSQPDGSPALRRSCRVRGVSSGKSLHPLVPLPEAHGKHNAGPYPARRHPGQRLWAWSSSTRATQVYRLRW